MQRCQPLSNTVERLASLFRGTRHEGVSIQQFWMSGFPDGAFMFVPGRAPDNDEWHSLRLLTRDLGLYPILTRQDNAEPYLNALPPEPHEDLGDWFKEACSDSLLVDGANYLSTGGSSNAFSPTRANDMFGWLDDSTDHWAHPLGQMRRRFGDAPSIQQLRDLHNAGTLSTNADLERWLLDWEVKRFGDAALVPESVAYLDGWELDGTSPCVVVLLPTLDSWRVLLSLGWWGLEAGAAEKAAAVRVWGERYGAELTRSFVTTLHLRVARRPASIDEAFALAIEHRHFASDTLALPGISLRDHARALLTLDRWYFHARP
jgi:hypothetical protein